MKCPHCAEEINDEAKKCRFCNEWLVPQSIAPPIAPPPIVINSAALEKNVKPVVKNILAAVQYFAMYMMLGVSYGILRLVSSGLGSVSLSVLIIPPILLAGNIMVVKLTNRGHKMTMILSFLIAISAYHFADNFNSMRSVYPHAEAQLNIFYNVFMTEAVLFFIGFIVVVGMFMKHKKTTVARKP